MNQMAHQNLEYLWQFKAEATQHMIFKLGLTFGVGFWFPVEWEKDKPRMRWKWEWDWKNL